MERSGARGASSPAFDLADTLERFGGDEALVSEVAKVFLEDYAAGLERVRAALDASDAAALHRAAHAIKGAVASFGASAAVEAARDVERAGRGGDLSAATESCRRLEAEVERLAGALEAFRR